MSMLSLLPQLPSLAELQVGALLVLAVNGSCLLLHCVVPARAFAGYVLDASGKHALLYRLNGLRVLLLVVALLPPVLSLLWPGPHDFGAAVMLRMIGEHYWVGNGSFVFLRRCLRP